MPKRLEPIAIRSIRPGDANRLRDHHDGLSRESSYRRFLAAKPHLSGADARYLSDVDGTDHHALVATLPEVAGEPIVGVARYIRIPQEREVAEVAIVVTDEHQRHGLGVELVSQLADRAVANGINRFRATTLTDNVASRRLFENVAAGPLEVRRLGGITELQFPLPGGAADPMPEPRAGKTGDPVTPAGAPLAPAA